MPTPEQNQNARDFLAENLNPDTTGIEASVKNALADAYVAGKFVAASQLKNSVTTAKVTTENTDDYWTQWKPGNVDASDLLDDGGFQDLLASRNIEIKGISDTIISQMGTMLSQGAARGDSVDTIADSLYGILGDSDRSYLIANTELNRAVSQSSVNAYDEMGLKQWDWVVSDGACDECAAMADGGPYDIGSEDPPPMHPGCRCAASPTSNFAQDLSTDDTSEDDISE